MKTQNAAFLETLGKAQMNELVKEVKETIATNVVINAKKPFGAADLWNLERNRRSRVIRRHFA